jgi:hypothetical protein
VHAACCRVRGVAGCGVLPDVWRDGCRVSCARCFDERRAGFHRAPQAMTTVFHVKHRAGDPLVVRDDEYRPVLYDGALAREGFRSDDERVR